MAKTYTVVKDGTKLKNLKTLAAAKKLADEENGAVLCESETVYTAVPSSVSQPSAVLDEENTVEDKAVGETPVAEDKPAVDEKPTVDKDTTACTEMEGYAATENTAKGDPEEVAPKPTIYTLTAHMNVRKEPSLNAQKLKVLDKGTVVEAITIENDWLHLTDGSFILYGSGKYAKKN